MRPLNRLALQTAFRQQRMSNGIIPKSALYASRLGMTNKYAHDYACEDEYFEREMTLLEAKTMHLPIPEDFKHKELPFDEI